MFFVKKGSIAKILGGGVEMVVEDDATVLSVIKRADEIIRQRGALPFRGRMSLLHMVYNPIEDRFYKQVGLHAFTTPGSFYNIRDNVRHKLLDGMTIILIPDAGCIGDFEEALKYEEFTKALSTNV